MLRFLTRQQIDAAAWDRCVAGAHNALLYGHSWYLDGVCNVPGKGPRWKWEGLVQTDEAGRYVAVLPVPLRRRWGFWVVYQPLFCQFLAIFSTHPTDPTPFLTALFSRYWYASRLCLLANAPFTNVPAGVVQHMEQTVCVETHSYASPMCQQQNTPNPVDVRILADASETHRYASLRYTPDRRMNLRRAHRRVAETPGWQVRSGDDVKPLLQLFRENHAGEIGVGEWAYGLFEQVFNALQVHGAATLRYAYVGNVPVAGALFAQAHGRTIYLFNAANAEGRRLNARTLLIDEALNNTTGIFDFESPDKPSIVQFYESFGATPQPFVQLTWNRLGWWVQKFRHRATQRKRELHREDNKASV